MKRFVAGVGEVELTPEEVAAVEAEQAAIDNAPVPVPYSVEMRQARLALLGAGLLSTVDAAFAALPGDEGEAARIQWDYATIITRSNPLMVSMASALSLTEEQVDDLFRAAKAIP